MGVNELFEGVGGCKALVDGGIVDASSPWLRVRYALLN